MAEDEKVNIDEVMAWEWINNSPIPHPMHIHNVQFQVVERTCRIHRSELRHDQPGTCRQRLEGHRAGLARRTSQDRHDIWTPYGHVHVPLPHPGARRHDDDAQPDDFGRKNAGYVKHDELMIFNR